MVKQNRDGLERMKDVELIPCVHLPSNKSIKEPIKETKIVG